MAVAYYLLFISVKYLFAFHAFLSQDPHRCPVLALPCLTNLKRFNLPFLTSHILTLRLGQQIISLFHIISSNHFAAF